MAESGRLAALETAAADAQRGLESRISSLADRWRGEARHQFEAEHLAPVLDGGRNMRVELASIAQLAARADAELNSS
jgi:hypothetical protein